MRCKFKILMPSAASDLMYRALTLIVGKTKYFYDVILPTATTFGTFEGVEGTKIKLELQDHWGDDRPPKLVTAEVIIQEGPVGKGLCLVVTPEPPSEVLSVVPGTPLVTEVETPKPVIAKEAPKKDTDVAKEDLNIDLDIAMESSEEKSKIPEEKPESAMPESVPPERRTRKKKRKL